MAELKFPVSALSLISQPVVIVKRDCIVYMNPAAETLAGKDLTGKSASVLLPTHILEQRGNDFVAAAFVGKRSCVVNAYRCASEHIYILSPEPDKEFTEAAVFASLRNSLTNLKLSGSRISRLAEVRCDDVLRSYAISVNRSYYRMKRNVDNLSLIELIKRGEYPMFAEPTDLVELFSTLIDSINILLGCAPVIKFHAPESLHIVVDRYLAELSLLNLISNSLAHCDEHDRITVSLLHTDKSTVIAVDDSGSGIPSDEIPYIFDRNHRNTNLTAAAQGVGLGLATVRHVAELHAGALVVESRGIGYGTSVRLMFSNFVIPTPNLKAEPSIYESCGLISILQELCDKLPDDCYSALTDD